MNRQAQRTGVLIAKPHRRLTPSQVRLVDQCARELLEDPGLYCYNRRAADLFRGAGARVTESGNCWRLSVPGRIIDRALATAPSTVVLGARDPASRLVLDAAEPRVRFGSGSETNTWLEVDFTAGTPAFRRQPGTIALLARSAHLCEHLEHLDFFLRNVNIQDPEVTGRNKDVNKFLASLNNTTRHVQAGLTDIAALDEVIRLGEIVAGGRAAFAREPLVSFITCVIKSPLQIVNDTAETLIEIATRRVPVVISSCPMGGATGPFDEFAMVAQINAELLAGVALHQLAAPGAPVLYGSVPVRTRLDNLNDMYGAPEFNHYNLDCVQMARHYRLPCYSTAGVGDTDRPGIQATVEKMMTLMSVPAAGPQYLHYAFGLLNRTETFCPEQAVLDDVQIGIVKQVLRAPGRWHARRRAVLAQVREVMASDHRTYMYHLPLPSREPVYTHYPLEDRERGALFAAHRRYREIVALPRRTLPERTRRDIARHVPGVLPAALT